jgi:c-di-GMP-binding flagellar brake protein YcgR
MTPRTTGTASAGIRGEQPLWDERAGKERRRWPRFPVTIRAWLKINRNGIEHFTSGTCYDIGEGGTRMFVASELHPGEEVRMRIALPYGQPVELAGVIRNRHRFEYGIEFVEVSEEDRERLVRNCTALALLL